MIVQANFGPAIAGWNNKETGANDNTTQFADLLDDTGAATGIAHYANLGGSYSGGDRATGAFHGLPELFWDGLVFDSGPQQHTLSGLTPYVGQTYTLTTAHFSNSARDNDVTVDGTTLQYNSIAGNPPAPLEFTGTISGDTLVIDIALVAGTTTTYFQGFTLDIAAATPTVTDVDAMAHGSSSNITVSNFATAATTGNSTLTSGTVVLTPSGVAGSVLTFPISRLDLQEGSYTWTLDIAGETASTGSVAYTIDGNGTDEFYGTVADQAAWIAEGYTEVVDGDNIYAIRTSGTTTPVLASCSFTGPSTWDIYIQDVADDVWGSSGTLTVPAAPSPSFLPSFARFNNQLIGGM